MTADHNQISIESTLLFSEGEWEAAMPVITQAMTDYLKQFRTPIFIDHGDYAEPWGTGSFLELDGQKFILTNEHVVRPRVNSQLGFRFEQQPQLLKLLGDHVEHTWPWDLALVPIVQEVWSTFNHGSAPIHVDQIALAHDPFPTEVFAFSGYAGESSTFLFGEMQFGATTSLALELSLIPSDEIDPRFHFGLAYRPDLATAVVGGKGLPKPPGLSGSTVWNTRFVEAKYLGIDWTPSLAKVAGVVWGWPSGQGAIVATKAEHVRSFLLGAKERLLPSS